MKRFLTVCTLCLAWAMGSVERANAQYPYNYGYSPYYGGTQLNVMLPRVGYQNYNGYNPYSLYGPAASYPTLLNPNYVVGNNGVLIVPYKSPNIYAPRRYEYKPYAR